MARSITGPSAKKILTSRIVASGGATWPVGRRARTNFKVKCRTEQGGVSGPYGVTQGAGYDFQGHSLQILVL